ncbi:MAG: ParB/RepB/Spo0J family partition protein, partial [Patescibacteria group bacterium]|nr:ParB/RepB/Spo0J family partition protein [Patescibacteria group bacterium]
MPDHRQVTELSINHLQPNPLQPRGAISGDELQELAASIREHGILEPLVVAHTPAGYQIVAGERRWRAAKIAGLETVPVIIKETSPTGMLEMALVENVQRTDLNALERAKAFERLMYDFGLSVSDIARRISKSSSFVSNTMRLLILPDAVKDGLISGLITEGHARALLGIPDVKEMIEVYKILLKESANVRRAEDLARRVKDKMGYNKARNQDQQFIVSDQIDMMEKNLHMILAKTLAKSKVKLTRSRAET